MTAFDFPQPVDDFMYKHDFLISFEFEMYQ